MQYDSNSRNVADHKNSHALMQGYIRECDPMPYDGGMWRHGSQTHVKTTWPMHFIWKVQWCNEGVQECDHRCKEAKDVKNAVMILMLKY